VPSRVAPRLCYSLAESWCRFARRPDAVGPCRYLDHPDLYACGARAFASAPCPSPPSCLNHIPMPKEKHVSETPATQLLKKLGVTYTEHTYDYVDRGGARESARQLGVDL